MSTFIVIICHIPFLWRFGLSVIRITMILIWDTLYRLGTTKQIQRVSIVSGVHVEMVKCIVLKDSKGLELLKEMGSGA